MDNFNRQLGDAHSDPESILVSPRNFQLKYEPGFSLICFMVQGENTKE